MDKIDLTVSVDQEVMSALTIYLGKKGGGTVQKELEKRLSELYDEAVPEPVREYIGLRFHPAAAKPHPRKAPSKPTATSAPAQTEHSQPEEPARGGDGHDG